MWLRKDSRLGEVTHTERQEDRSVSELLDHLRQTKLTLPEIRRRVGQIHESVLENSEWIREGNFAAIHNRDLEFLFQQYDDTFFNGLLGPTARLNQTPLTFRISKRMTRVGGTTTRTRSRRLSGPRQSYEIAVSSTLLFTTFHDVQRTVTVSGVSCRDRLEALQRIFEHELIHLTEMVLWDDSSCSQQRFQSLSFQLFAHTEHTHQLITPGERAREKFGIKTGDRVRFRIDGAEYVGIVNRITRRATVLVEDRNSPLYSDGKRYARFYVPLPLLQPDDGDRQPS